MSGKRCGLAILSLLALFAIRPAHAQEANAQGDWQKQWADVQAKAKGQDLNLTVHATNGSEQLVQVFQKRFPDIKVHTTAVGPSDMAPRILTEQKNGVFAWDSWWAATSNMTSLVLPAGGFEKITDYFILPEIKDPSNWLAPQKDWYTADTGPYIFVPSYYQETSVWYNKDVVPGLDIKSAKDFLDPRLKGLISIRDPRRPNEGSYTLAALSREDGLDFVKQIATQQDPTFIDNARQLTDTLLRGDKALVFGASEDVVEKCWASGGCKSVVRLPFGHLVFARGVAVMKNAPHKEATTVWINWLLSKEGQQAFVETWAKYNDIGAISQRKDVPPNPKEPQSVPDYAHLDNYFLSGNQSGQGDVKAITSYFTGLRPAGG